MPSHNRDIERRIKEVLQVIHSLALVGFQAHEKQILSVFFGLTVRRAEVYTVVNSTAEAKVLLVDADSATGMQWLGEASSSRRTMLVVGGAGTAPHLPTVHRPYALLTLVERLDLLVLASAGRQPPVLEAAPPPVNSQLTARHCVKPVEPAPAARPSDSVRQGTGVAPVVTKLSRSRPASSFLGFDEAAAVPQKADAYDDILVVDDSDIALKFMQKLLTRFGFRAELAKSGEDALARIHKKNYRFVFIDVMMDGMDGYQTCRAIKQRKYIDSKPPVVVMLTSRGASMDKMRGSLAGCDAYLTKPLEENALLQTLSKYDEQVQRGFQDTNFGSSELNQFGPAR